MPTSQRLYSNCYTIMLSSQEINTLFRPSNINLRRSAEFLVDKKYYWLQAPHLGKPWQLLYPCFISLPQGPCIKFYSCILLLL